MSIGSGGICNGTLLLNALYISNLIIVLQR